ncbi:MAG: DUF3048 domain-containing protein [Oscillospiraceae bacterium]|nr:DUF3048 domain-containing protein [Oscillospiraceae bacterium]
MEIKKFISIITAAAILFAAAFMLPSCKKEQTDNTTTEGSSETETQDIDVPGLTDPLTGQTGYDEKYENSKPIGIVVENHPKARPQWGFTTPDIVMEYEVEGGISRMLWLYSNADKVPEKVGPVRSARHDIVELAIGMDMLFVHCGGSDMALNMIKQHRGTLSEIDGLTYDGCFYRDKSRGVSTEHTLVLTGSGLRQSIADLGLETQVDPAYKKPFSFEKRTLNGNDCTSIHFEYSSSYKYDFTFNETAGKYNPKINGTPCTDENRNECSYTNVLILYVQMADMHDSSGHQDLLLQNGGKGVYISGGKLEEISWTKGETTDKLQLLSADGSPLTLNPGNSYIGFVRSTQQGKSIY